jgi:hypothetical protein
MRLLRVAARDHAQHRMPQCLRSAEPDVSGQATIAANGQLFTTEHGRKVEREEWLESWS